MTGLAHFSPRKTHNSVKLEPGNTILQKLLDNNTYLNRAQVDFGLIITFCTIQLQTIKKIKFSEQLLKLGINIKYYILDIHLGNAKSVETALTVVLNARNEPEENKERAVGFFYFGALSHNTFLHFM